MHRLVALLTLTFLSALIATQALALPAPMSDDELLAKSDLVALIRVLWVTCTEVTKDDRTGEALPSYKASAEVMEVIKGDVAKGDDVTITFHAVPTHMLGPWTVYYYPGEMVFTHLVKDRDAYITTWWNGRGKLVNKAIITDLPTKAGETVEVTRRTSHPGN